MEPKKRHRSATNLSSLLNREQDTRGRTSRAGRDPRTPEFGGQRPRVAFAKWPVHRTAARLYRPVAKAWLGFGSACCGRAGEAAEPERAGRRMYSCMYACTNDIYVWPPVFPLWPQLKNI